MKLDQKINEMSNEFKHRLKKMTDRPRKRASTTRRRRRQKTGFHVSLGVTFFFAGRKHSLVSSRIPTVDRGMCAVELRSPARIITPCSLEYPAFIVECAFSRSSTGMMPLPNVHVCA